MNEGNYTTQELMAVVLARELKDGEVGEPAAYSEIPMAACKLARLMHAPNLNWWCSATSFLNPKGPLYHSSTDYRNIEGAEAVLDLNDALFYSIPHYNFFFAGGIQVDQYGNLNLAVIGDYNRPRLRGPGCAGLCYVSALPIKYFIYMTRHDKMSFVEKVDFLVGVGYLNGGKSREEAGLVAGGPRLVVSPLGVFDFEEETKAMRVKSLHPGVSLIRLRENTGFDLVVPASVTETVPPSREEMKLLREAVDPYGVLRE